MKYKSPCLVSIALPTRNRSHVITDTVQCCLNQSYPNIEVVVTDNSDNDETFQALQKIGDTRLKYFKTGNLSMADNWDTALKKCSGDYLYIIGDKIRLHEHAVDVLWNGITHSGQEAYSFSHNLSDRSYSRVRKSWSQIRTSELVGNGLKGDITKYDEFGFRGYTLILSRELFDRITLRHGKISLPLSPDFTIAFLASMSCASFGFIPWCPFSYSYNSPSNGFSSTFGGNLSKEFLGQYNMTEDDAIAFAPIKIYTVWNSVLSDFFRICKMVGMEDLQSNVDIKRCWRTLYAEIVHHHMITHIDASDKLRTMFNLIEANPSLQGEEMGQFINSLALLTHQQAAVLFGSRRRLHMRHLLGRLKKRLLRVLRHAGNE